MQKKGLQKKERRRWGSRRKGREREIEGEKERKRSDRKKKKKDDGDCEKKDCQNKGVALRIKKKQREMGIEGEK